MKRDNLMVVPLPGFDPEIGRLMWCLEDIRQLLLKRISGISQELLDKRVDKGHSIGSLLYHIALIEADWLYEEVLEGEWNPDIRALFPHADRNNDGTLTYMEGETIVEHLHRLQSVRNELLFCFQNIDIKDWRKPKSFTHYDVTPEWVVFHLIEHESHHKGQIFQMLVTSKG